jgi:pimeloyl-ACP methyl ester carboxylesterase
MVTLKGVALPVPIGRWTEDAIAVLDSLTHGQQILVGSSMGGWIMLLAALAGPVRIHALVGVAAAPDFTEDLLWSRLDAAQLQELRETGAVTLPSEYDPVGRTLPAVDRPARSRPTHPTHHRPRVTDSTTFVHGGDTRAGRRTVQMHRAGAAERHAAAELGAGHAEHVSKHPQQRGVTVDIGGAVYAIDFDREDHRRLLDVKTP